MKGIDEEGRGVDDDAGGRGGGTNGGGANGGGDVNGRGGGKRVLYSPPRIPGGIPRNPGDSGNSGGMEF